METVLLKSEKRELDDSGCVQDDVLQKYQPRVQLLDFSDDVLLNILQFCSPRDIKAVGHTCGRLSVLIRDRSLWRRVDCRREPGGTARLRWYVSSVLHADTTELHCCGHESAPYGCLHLSAGMKKTTTSKNTSDDNETEAKTLNPDSEIINKILNSDNHSLLRENEKAEEKTDSAEKTGNGDVEMKKPDNNIKKEVEFEAKLVVTPKLLQKLHAACPNLSSISLEYCRLDCRKSGISMFPKNLKRLSLRGTICVNPPVEKAILFKIHDHLPVLEYLNLSECEWMEAVGLLPLSKMPNLKSLILQHCHKLNEFVAYASLAARYGFLALEVVDLRFSPVCDSEVSAFGWLPELRELYLQCAKSKHEQTREKHDPIHDEKEALIPLSDWEIPDITESDGEEAEEPAPASKPRNSWRPMHWPPEQPLNLSNWNRQDVFVIHNGPTAEIINIPFERDRPEYRRTIDAILPRRYEMPRSNPEEDLNRLASVTVRRIPTEDRRSTDESDDEDDRNEVIAPKRCKLAEPGTSGYKREGRPSVDLITEESDHIIELNDNVLVVNLSQRVKRKSEPEAGCSRMDVDLCESPKRSRNDPEPGPSNVAKDTVNNTVNNTVNINDDTVNINTVNVNDTVNNDNNQPSSSSQSVESSSQSSAGNSSDSGHIGQGDSVRSRRANDNPAHSNNEYRIRTRGQACSIGSFFRRDHRVQMVLGHGHLPPQRNYDADTFVDQSTFVSDSSIRHFGESLLGDIGYIHIGTEWRRKTGESYGRPRRSNLRVLSVRGYRHITDRSLNHLLTAAPFLTRIDFRDTGVTSAGVKTFKSLRPEVEVLYDDDEEKK